jgi:putative tricarboxylic transport membrane protein
MRGFSFVVAVIGLFGIGEIFLTVEEGLEFRGTQTQLSWRVILETLCVLPAYWKTFVRSALIGSWMGMKPGGATPASFMSYGIAPKFSKTPEKFGTGVLEGVLAPETAAHAAGRVGVAPHDNPGHSGFSDRCRDARRPPHLGSAAWVHAC